MPLFMQDDIDCGRLPEQGRNVPKARRAINAGHCFGNRTRTAAGTGVSVPTLRNNRRLSIGPPPIFPYFAEKPVTNRQDIEGEQWDARESEPAHALRLDEFQVHLVDTKDKISRHAIGTQPAVGDYRP
nr:uncharacterized protein LOC115265871 [Aedes albopictus]